MTCSSASQYAATLDGGVDLCATIQNAEVMCCPTIPTIPTLSPQQQTPGLSESTTCGFCSATGLTVEANTIIPNTNGSTCAVALATAATLDGRSEICATLQFEEDACCPSSLVDPPVAPCGFCASAGVTNPTFVIPNSDGMTCSSASQYAATLDSGGDICAIVQRAEVMCCPAWDVADPNEEYDTMLGMQSMSLSLSMSMSMSMSMPSSPPVLETPCNFCPDGLAVAEATVIPNTNGQTCGAAMNYADSLVEASAGCEEMKFATSVACCPAVVDVPCGYCSGSGITVDPATLIPNTGGTTCGNATTLASTIDGLSDFCATLQFSESTCCPQEPEPEPEPCDFCSITGFTVDANTIIVSD